MASVRDLPYLPTASRTRRRWKHWICGTIRWDKRKDFATEVLPRLDVQAGAAAHPGAAPPAGGQGGGDGEKVVILVAVTTGYAEMLMSFVCRLRMSGLAENLVVAALGVGCCTTTASSKGWQWRMRRSSTGA